MEKRSAELEGLVKFIFEHHTRLSCILRFNNTPRIASENVAEHSYYVAFLAMLMGDHLKKEGVDLDMLRLLQMALLHDIEEAISGDILAPMKRGKFKEALDKDNIKNIALLTAGLADGEKYSSLWREVADEATLEARVIKLVDKMSCFIYCIREVHLGNGYFKAVLEYETKNILKCAERIPNAIEFATEVVRYVVSYLSGNKEIYEAINKAMRKFANE